MADGDRIPKVLVVDDEPNIRELVEVALKFHGCAVSVSASGKDALHQAEAYEPDLMILDVMLPDMDGFEVCRMLRSEGNDVPVIFLTARDTTSDTIRGLTLGGDDYVTKPFSVEALVARVRAVLRRTTRAPGSDGPGDDAALLTVGDLELDEEHWVVRRGGTAVELSPTEFRLLAYLMRNQGRMLTRQQLLENVWGWEFAGQSQVVETYVSYLRRKLDPLGPPLIHTQRGVGYSLRPPPETERAGRRVNLTRRLGSGRGRLSLRSRLLAGLITVTALFLIIMGVVTTVVLGNSEQDQFNSDLALTVRLKLSELRQPAGRVRGGLLQRPDPAPVRVLTPPSHALRELTSFRRRAGRQPAGVDGLPAADTPRASCSPSRSRAAGADRGLAPGHLDRGARSDGTLPPATSSW